MNIISVIVPIYNVEKYLNKCIGSIVSQTYTDLEIILVDDGSTDTSPSICDNWAEKDPRIKVIHQQNGGGAKARNIGLNCATGQYISFVDSDDFIHPDMLHLMHQSLTNYQCDIAECDYDIDATKLFSDPCEIIGFFDTKQGLKENINDKILRQLIWNKLYTKAVIGNIRFTAGKTIDDEFFTYKVLANAKKTVVIHPKLYFYRQINTSVMHSTFSLKRLQAVEAKLERLVFIEQKHPELTHDAARNLWETCMYLMQMSMKYLSEEDYKKAYTYINDHIKDTMSKIEFAKLPTKNKIWFILSKISFRLTCKVRNILNYGL